MKTKKNLKKYEQLSNTLKKCEKNKCSKEKKEANKQEIKKTLGL